MSELSDKTQPAERKDYPLLKPLRQNGEDLVPKKGVTVSLTEVQHQRLSEDGVVGKQPAKP